MYIDYIRWRVSIASNAKTSTELASNFFPKIRPIVKKGIQRMYYYWLFKNNCIVLPIYRENKNFALVSSTLMYIQSNFAAIKNVSKKQKKGCGWRMSHVTVTVINFLYDMTYFIAWAILNAINLNTAAQKSLKD